MLATPNEPSRPRFSEIPPTSSSYIPNNQNDSQDNINRLRNPSVDINHQHNSHSVMMESVSSLNQNCSDYNVRRERSQNHYMEPRLIVSNGGRESTIASHLRNPNNESLNNGNIRTRNFEEFFLNNDGNISFLT